MRFVIAYRDIVGSPASLTFDAESIADALSGLKQRCIDKHSFVGETTSYRNAFPMVLVDESMAGYVLVEGDNGVMKIAEGAEEVSSYDG